MFLYSGDHVEEDHRYLSQPVCNSTLIRIYDLQVGNAVAINCTNAARLSLSKYVSKDLYYGVSNVSHCPAVDNGVDGRIKENKRK